MTKCVSIFNISGFVVVITEVLRSVVRLYTRNTSVSFGINYVQCVVFWVKTAGCRAKKRALR